MDDLHKKHALELVEHLERAGLNCGLLAVHGTVVLRCPGVPYTETPLMMFNENDLHNAVALDLLGKQKVKVEMIPSTGNYEWEWYVVKKPNPK
ncbi:MAG: hypothetical protein ABSF71_09765 [Terriglobia bacterium]|jgi:hypothetical protein